MSDHPSLLCCDVLPSQLTTAHSTYVSVTTQNNISYINSSTYVTAPTYATSFSPTNTTTSITSTTSNTSLLPSYLSPCLVSTSVTLSNSYYTTNLISSSGGSTIIPQEFNSSLDASPPVIEANNILHQITTSTTKQSLPLPSVNTCCLNPVQIPLIQSIEAGTVLKQNNSVLEQPGIADAQSKVQIKTDGGASSAETHTSVSYLRNGEVGGKILHGSNEVHESSKVNSEGIEGIPPLGEGARSTTSQEHQLVGATGADHVTTYATTEAEGITSTGSAPTQHMKCTATSMPWVGYSAYFAYPHGWVTLLIVHTQICGFSAY